MFATLPLAARRASLPWRGGAVLAARAVNEAPLTGGPVTTLVTGQPSPVGVAVSP